MLEVLQGRAPAGDLRQQFKRPEDLDALVAAIRNGKLRDRNKALAVLARWLDRESSS
jgi:hypothetical protein